MEYNRAQLIGTPLNRIVAMGKTPKKAAPGGDERNLYVRRLKATTAPSRASESSFLPERQRESEISNRPKLTGIQKRIPTGSGKNPKSKLRTSAKVGLSQTAKQLKLPMRNPEAKTTDNMQPELEEAEVKLNVSVQKENVKEEKSSINKTTQSVEEPVIDKEHIDHNVVEQTSSKPQTSTNIVDEIVPLAEAEIILLEGEGDLLDNISNTETKELEEQEENDMELKLQAEQSPTKEEEGKSDDKQMDDVKEDELLIVQDELKNGVKEKEEIQKGVQLDTESYSVDIVESTTSEVLETSESVNQNDTQRNKEKIDDTNNDASFISYDSSIMLKDVQIRLNDCLKDNTKLFDVSNAGGSSSQLPKDASFGETLRNISGRHSISRMRHVTLRERRISPNSSLFVNTSTTSIPQNEGTESKVLRYGLSDSFPTNGSSSNRKRKIETSTWGSVKKQKSEADSSFLNTSMTLLKGLYKPVQVSTPNVTPYKFESKLDMSGVKDDDNKIATESTENAKKWCMIM